VEPYRYLEQVAGKVDSLDDREEINQVIDELQLVYEILDPEFQGLADDLIARLNARLDAGTK
jgi:hypothetical protein